PAVGQGRQSHPRTGVDLAGDAVVGAGAGANVDAVSNDDTLGHQHGEAVAVDVLGVDIALLAVIGYKAPRLVHAEQIQLGPLADGGEDLVVGAGTGAEVHIAAVAVNNGAAVVRPGAVGHRGDGFRDSFRLLGRAVVGGGEDQIVGGDVTGVIAVAHLIPAVQDRQDLDLGAVGEIGDGGSVRGGLDADPQGIGVYHTGAHIGGSGGGGQKSDRQGGQEQGLLRDFSHSFILF